MSLKMTLEHFSLIEVNFMLNKGYVQSGRTDELSPEIRLGAYVEKDRKEIVVAIGVRAKKGNTPYYFEVHGAGLFKVHGEMPDEQTLEQLKTINCPAIIFPYIRETIADLTRRAGFSPFHISAVNFIDLAETTKHQKKKNKKQQKGGR